MRNVTIWCALERPGLGQPFKYLGHYHVTSKKVLEPLEAEKCLKNWPKLRNFESLSWLWKTRFGLWRVLWILASLLGFVMSRFDVRWKSLGLGQPFKYLERYHISSKKVFRATWSWKMPQILFVRANWDFRNFWVLVSFWSIFQLQVALKTFLRVIYWCSRYLKGCPRWGLSSAHRIMTVRLTNNFLLTEVLIPPTHTLCCWFSTTLLYILGEVFWLIAKRMIKSPQPPYPARWGINHWMI